MRGCQKKYSSSCSFRFPSLSLSVSPCLAEFWRRQQQAKRHGKGHVDEQRTEEHEDLGCHLRQVSGGFDTPGTLYGCNMWGPKK